LFEFNKKFNESKKEQAANALKLDRTPIDGRPMFVSKNRDKNDKTLDFLEKQFKYSTNLEKTKLFVSGLPYSMEKPALEDLFKNVVILTEAS
jgi:RNA recognition motif-containing protein